MRVSELSARRDLINIVLFKIPVAEIVSHIENGEWTATQVLEAYLSRAAFAQAKTNCLTEGKCFLFKLLSGILNDTEMFKLPVMVGPARQRAADLDAEFAATKKLKGPLHGVPVRSVLPSGAYKNNLTQQC